MKPSSQYEEEIEKILQTVTPTNDIHQGYLNCVDGFVKEYNYFVSVAKANGQKIPAIYSLPHS